MIKRKGVTKGDLVRSIKTIWNVVQVVEARVRDIERTFNEYIDFKKDEKKFVKYLDKKAEEIIEDEEKKSKSDKEK